MVTYTYIKNDIPKNYIVLESALDSQYYDNIGVSIEDYKDGKWVLLNADQVAFLNEHPGVSMEEVYNMKLVIVPEPTLEMIKEGVIKNILDYDNSNNVNVFLLGETPIWLDKATRAGLKLRFEAELKAKHNETTLWYNGIPYPISLDVAIEMLYLVEIYASACYDNTQQHIYNVNKLTSVDDVLAYNYTSGYPEILRF